MIKDYKVLLVGALLLTLIVFVLICAWLWNHNRKNINPVPIISDTRANDMPAAGSELVHTAQIHVQAAKTLEPVIEDLIVRFESRYPNTQVTVNYTDNADLFNVKTNGDVDNTYLVDTDIIMADSKLAQSQIQRLQEMINQTQEMRNQQTPTPPPTEKTPAADGNSSNSEVPADKEDGSTVQGAAKNNDASEGTTTQTAQNTQNKPNNQNSNEARKLNAFSYALKKQQSEHTIEGMILTENPAAVSFRNYVLSSAGQDILSRYDYGNIDGYQKNIDDLFNPTTVENKESPVDVADALTNGEK